MLYPDSLATNAQVAGSLNMAQRKIGIGMIGCGTIGGGVAMLLGEQAERYRERTGLTLELKSVLVRSQDVERTSDASLVDEEILTDDADVFFNTEGIDIIIELAGGRGVISQYVRRALESGRHVVTANKALVAAEGPELFALARKSDVTLAFEASCGGGIPCINALMSGLMANEIQRMYGILNGTCNYILTEMIEHGRTYGEVLKEAQEMGYAEADPTLDVGGHDTASKIAILASLAFGVKIDPADVWTKGIDGLALADVEAGGELGYDMKLLGIAERFDNGSIGVTAEPCFIAHRALLAEVGGAFNALSVYGHAVGHTMYYGQGAGRFPTASAVIADVLNIVNGSYIALFNNMSLTPDLKLPGEIRPLDQCQGRWYLRFDAMDRAGTVAGISDLLGSSGISISAVIQHEEARGQHVPLVFATHEAKRGDVEAAIVAAKQLDVVAGEPVVIRIVDMQ